MREALAPFAQSRRMQSVQTPIIPVVGEWIRQHPGTISLAQGVVNYGPPPAAAEAVRDFLSTGGEHKYGAVQGLPLLLDATATKLRVENRIDIGDAADRLIVTGGANMAFLNALFAITDPGDEVILPLPYYFNHEMAIRMLNCVPIAVPTDDHNQLCPEAIRRAITPRTRAVVTISPNNPSGAVYPANVLGTVNAICRDAGIFHISDEAYEYFTYGEARHFSPGSLADADRHTISLYSLSKSWGFASWRIGYMVVPPQLYEAVLKAQDTNLICASLIAQFAAAAVMRSDPAYRTERLAELSQVRSAVLDELGKIDSLCRHAVPQGAFYVLLNIDSPLPDTELVHRLIREHGVAVLPGSVFGIDKGCHLRISYGALAGDTAVAGIRRLVHGLQAVCR
jgi:aspartate/methionine/tyrosine aminotransferase